MISRSFWSMPSWYLHAVAVGEHVAAADSAAGSAAQAGQTDKGELFAWSGFQVTLYRDACERYWHALIGDKPLVYVVCREIEDVADDAIALRPVLVTIDYDEAAAFLENDELVLSGPIPAELYRHMEAFVLQHYKPKEFKKRKRHKWSNDSSQGPASGQQ
ncbi:hypothetical protein IMCC3135_25275 [Granulosicoccus antarcticus IMCC3135]|uniref:DUF3305 domain-containing protein n=2 Tax=Granulosicoccus TaxID=437504 RepID=A0A2Z2NZA8_9GAMM|nr:hypothetical protein IMCC3135_25275 [Granulosicoccus antarcticus IMCC3135]